MTTITLKSYEDRVNKNQKVYLVIKDVDDVTYMCQDPRLFDVIKGSSVINAEVAVETNGSATFRKIVTADMVQAGTLAKTDPKPRWSGNGSGGSGGNGSFKADPYKQALIIRQNVLERGLETAKLAYEAGQVQPTEGQSAANAIVTLGIAIAEKLEKWVRSATPVQDPAEQTVTNPQTGQTQTYAAPQAVPAPQTTPAPAPAAPQAPQAPQAPGSEFEGGLPF